MNKTARPQQTKNRYRSEKNLSNLQGFENFIGIIMFSKSKLKKRTGLIWNFNVRGAIKYKHCNILK